MGRLALPGDLVSKIACVENGVQQHFQIVARRFENSPWGAPHIRGQLLKLGVDVAQSTISK